MAPFFPKEKLLEIRNRANIVDVISDYVTLKKAGKNYQALCPFHSENTPSFIVNEEKQLFYCFGCQKGGDAITFLQEINTISFHEAVTLLAGKYGISLPLSPYKQGDDKTESLIAINEKVAAYYHRMLVERSEGEIGRQYLKKRGIDDRVWETFKLGYAPEQWEGLTRFLSLEKIPLALAQPLGLIASKKSGGFFDCFRGRIIFPIFNVNSNVIGFGGRAITGGTPKYLNSSDSIIYKKSFSLFGLPLTRDAIRHEDRVFIVEGYFDLLSLYKSGVCSVVSPLGTALTSGHIQTLRRYTSNYYIVFDADEAGSKAALRSLELFLDEGISPRVVILPPGLDPDDVIRESGPEIFLNQLKQAPLLLEYYIDETIKKKDISRSAGKVDVLKTIMPVIRRIAQPIIQDEYILRLSEKLGVREDRIRNFSTLSPQPKPDTASSQMDENRREEFLLTLMLQQTETIPTVSRVQVIDDFDNPLFREIGSVIIETFQNEGKLHLASLIDKFEEEQKHFITALSLKEENFGSIAGSLKDCICQIKRNRIRKMQLSLTQKIKKAQEGHDEVEIRDLHRKKIQLLLQEKNLPNTISSLLNL